MGKSPGFNCRGPCPACKENKTHHGGFIKEFQSSHSHTGWGDYNYTIYHTNEVIKTLGPFRMGYMNLQFKVENGNIGFRYFMNNSQFTTNIANTFIISLSHPKSIQKVHTWMEKVFKLFCDPKPTHAPCRSEFNKVIQAYTRRLGHGDWTNL
jgi:hypothetical protein